MIISGLLFALIATPIVSLADEKAPVRCFDFDTKIVTPLRAPPLTFDPKNDPSEMKSDKKFNWAAVSGQVEKPILELYQKLTDPRTIRDNPDMEIKVKETPSKDYLKRITQSLKISPVFFLTLRWDEEWVYALKEGTPEAPKTIVISYEKTKGTSHIEHLCGNIVLKSLGPKATGVSIYEEMKADRRDAQDILNNITGTLRALRGIPAPTGTPSPSSEEKTTPTPASKSTPESSST